MGAWPLECGGPEQGFEFGHLGLDNVISRFGPGKAFGDKASIQLLVTAGTEDPALLTRMRVASLGAGRHQVAYHAGAGRDIQKVGNIQRHCTRCVSP